MILRKPQIAYPSVLGLFLGLAISLLRPFSAEAYQLADHKRITEQAIQELVACFPNARPSLTTKWILLGDLGEDVNLVTKELLYSHYFNPHKKLPMYRYDSSVRISRLETALAPVLAAAGTESAARPTNSFSTMLELGQVIHHLQDSSTPPHVVPVSHSLSDGFESYSFDGDIGSDMSCAEMAAIPRTPPAQVLIETAEATLLTVATLKFEVEQIQAGHVQTLSLGLNAFWQEASGDAFGDYGIFGNNFGRPQFTLKSGPLMGTLYNVPAEVFASLKQKQMKLGVRTTIRALVWYLNPMANPPKNPLVNP
jgi:hypothetical protein